MIQRGSIGLDPSMRPRLGAASSEEMLLQNRVAELGRQWPRQLCRSDSRQVFLDGTALTHSSRAIARALIPAPNAAAATHATAMVSLCPGICSPSVDWGRRCEVDADP